MSVVTGKKKREDLARCPESSDPILRLLENSAVKVRRVRRGELACCSLDAAESVYFVKMGCVKLVRYSASGEEVVIDRYYARSLFGNLHFCNWSLYCECRDRELAVAVEDSEIIITTFESLKNNLNRYPEAAIALLGDYCQRLAAARLRIESFVLHEAEERLARVLLIMAAYQQPNREGPVLLKKAVTHEELAQLIGVTRPFVTKLIGQLKGRGFIESVGAGQLVVHQNRILEGYSFPVQGAASAPP
jgi:CRP-like cAMP-binding protein